MRRCSVAFDATQLAALHMRKATDECQLDAVATVFYASLFFFCPHLSASLFFTDSKAATVVTRGPILKHRNILYNLAFVI